MEHMITCVNFKCACPDIDRDHVGCLHRQSSVYLCAGMRTYLSTCSVSHQARTSQISAKRNYLQPYYWHVTAELHNSRDSWWLPALWWGNGEDGVIMSAEPEANHQGETPPSIISSAIWNETPEGENKRRQMSLAVNWKMQPCKQ